MNDAIKFSNQHEITERSPLLDSNGELVQKGYAKKLLLDYDRNAIKAKGYRIKEWDYYYVGNKDYAIALTMDDNSYMGMMSASLLDFNKKWEKTTSLIIPFTFGKIGIPATSEKGDIKFKNKKVDFRFENDGVKRHLYVKYLNFMDNKPLEIDITLSDFPEESMVIATPFPGDKKAFYYNQKINCMSAEGYARFNDKEYRFNRKNGSMGLLDWGRGVWTYKNTWYWGSMSTYLGDNKFGFNIGYGFGDTSCASENMLFYNGKAHKLSQVTFNIPTKNGQDDFLSDWTFTSDDKRFEFNFHPLIDRASDTNVLVIRSNQHQVFGLFTGRAILDDGTVIELKDELGFAEKVYNKW